MATKKKPETAKPEPKASAEVPALVKESEQGYAGVKVDPLPNSTYTAPRGDK